NDLSRQTGLQFVYNAQQAGNPRTRAMPAGLAPQQALEQLLDGTGLRYRYLNDTTVTIEARSDAAPSGTSAVPIAASAVAFEAEPAGAGDAGLQQLERIDVVGSYSRSLEQAVDIKRATIGFSDSIVATDVADFPEQNLAEALQRMPGVTIERDKGLG